jgi:hypothetical protein
MKKIVLMIFLIFVSFSCVEKTKNTKGISEPTKVKKSNLNISSSNEYYYKSDSLNIQLLILRKTKQIEFDISINAIKETFNLKKNANLILIEDENGKLYVPEVSFILDSNSNEEYICDSTYEYISDKICFSFSFEKSTNKRLSLVIYKSQIDFIKDNEYTLYEK